MHPTWPKLKIKLRLFLPLLLGIMLSTFTANFLLIRNSLKIFNRELESSLQMEVTTILKMMEREKSLKSDQVATNLNIAHNYFHAHTLKVSSEQVRWTIENQFSHDIWEAGLHKWIHGGKVLHNSNDFVDSLQALIGGTVTVFQWTDSGFVRISTNVRRQDGSRAVGTYIPNSSVVAETILRGEKYTGRAFVVDDWYITAYEPICFNGQVAGSLYVGGKEKDLAELRRLLYGLEIGASGYPYVFDEQGNMIIHKFKEGTNNGGDTLVKEMMERKTGLIRHRDEQNGTARLTAFSYFPDFRLYVAATISPAAENRSMVRSTIIYSALITLLVIIALSVYIYFQTTDKLSRFIHELESAGRKLTTAKDALKLSERKYRTLFEGVNDEIFLTDLEGRIIEMNQSACTELEYSPDELIGKNFETVKSDAFRHLVPIYRKKIIEKGKLTHESEHVSKSGKIFPVEIKSRLIEYNQERYILSIARDMTERTQMERKILSAIIKTEEREKERFARDMHDGLGPLLSTIKLYINEITDEQGQPEEKVSYSRLASELIDEAIENTRDISNNLMPRIIHEYGLVKALESFCHKIRRTTKIKFSIESSIQNNQPDINIQLILFRVVSELINNTIRHASATLVTIKLEKSANQLYLLYQDDGRGFDMDNIMNEEKQGMGIRNITSRIKSINGQCTFESQPGQGVKVRIAIRI